MEEIRINELGSIVCDFEGIKSHIEEQLQLYSNLVFTEETKKEAKDTVAELRKEKKAFQDRVKEVKAEWMKPFDEFFVKASEITILYDAPIAKIGEQIEAFEKQRIEAKREEIKKIYTELVPEEDLNAVIPLHRIFNPKWENATYTAKQIREDVMKYKEDAKTAIETIKSMESDKEEDALKLYKLNLDLTACIKYITDYEKQKKEVLAREEQRLKEEAEARIRAEERAKIEAEQQKAVEIQKAKEEVIAELIPEDEGEEAKSYSYTITMTAKAKESLEIFMNSIGIEFEELDF